MHRFLQLKEVSSQVANVPGTAVFLTGDTESAPTALLHSLKHYKVLHERNVIFTVKGATVPVVEESRRLKIEQLSDRLWRIEASFGFMENPNVPATLLSIPKQEMSFSMMDTSFFLSRRSVRASKYQGMPVWQDNLFIMMARNANDASSYFRLPPVARANRGCSPTIRITARTPACRTRARADQVKGPRICIQENHLAVRIRSIKAQTISRIDTFRTSHFLTHYDAVK